MSKRPAPAAPAPAEPPIDARVIDAKVTENILEKIAAGGVPTAREERILKASTEGREERGQGRPSKEIRWTVEHAATEFGLDRRTLAGRIRKAGIPAGDDGKYSTRQIVETLFGSQSPRDQKDLQHAELLRVQTENAKRERIPLALVAELWEAAVSATAATLKAAKGKTLTPEKINDLLTRLRTVALPLKW